MGVDFLFNNKWKFYWKNQKTLSFEQLLISLKKNSNDETHQLVISNWNKKEKKTKNKTIFFLFIYDN